MNISKEDINILRELAHKKAEIAAESVQKENIKLWTATNDLEMIKAPVYINEIPWFEMNVNDELTIQTKAPFCQGLETALRREIYCWEHLPGNMVVKPVMECHFVLKGTGFGIDEKVDI